MLGIIFVIMSASPFEQISVYVKPVFHFVLLLFYCKSVRKTRSLVFVFFLSAMCAEVLFSSNIIKSYSLSFGCHTICFLSGTLLLYPLIKKVTFKFEKSNLLGLIFLILGLGYIISSTYLISTKELGNNNLLIIAIIPFLTLVSSCFYLMAFYNHTKSILLFLTGICLIINNLGGLIRHFYFPFGPVPAIIINTSEVMYQVTFVFFMINYDQISKQEKWIY